MKVLFNLLKKKVVQNTESLQMCAQPTLSGKCSFFKNQTLVQFTNNMKFGCSDPSCSVTL